MEIIEKDGTKVEISEILRFNIEELNKKFVMYSVVDDDEKNKDGLILVGEVVEKEDGTTEILGVRKEDEKLVNEVYKKLVSQLGD